MPEKRSTLKSVSDTWQLFCWHHPWAKSVSRACFYTLCCPLACCYCCLSMPSKLMPRCGNYRMGKRDRERSKMFALQIEKRQRQHERRHSLTEKRTETSKVGGFLKRRGRWLDQESSAFFSKLPAELRMRIYELVLNGDNFLHLIPNYQEGKFGINTSFLGRNADLFADVEEDTPRAVANGNHYENLDIMSRLKHYSTVRRLKSTPSLLSLLLTCRRVYAEAIPLLYSGNTFVTSLGGNLNNFARSLPNIHLNRITSLVLYTPVPGWHMIDSISLKFRNLKSCHIIVLDKFCGHSTHDSDDFEFLQKEVRSSLEGHPAKDMFVIDIWSAVEAYLDNDGRRRGWVLTRRWDLKVESTGKHAEYLA